MEDWSYRICSFDVALLPVFGSFGCTAFTRNFTLEEFLMTEEQLKTFVIDELSPFIHNITSDSDGIWASGKNNTYLAYYKRQVFMAEPGLYIAKFISDKAEVIHEDGRLYWGRWPAELRVSLDDDDEIRRRVYNIVKRMKEIKNNERMKKLQKDF